MKRYQLVITPIEFKHFYIIKNSIIFNGKIQMSSNNKLDCESFINKYKNDKSIENMKIIDLAIEKNFNEFVECELITNNEIFVLDWLNSYGGGITDALEEIKNKEADWSNLDWDSGQASKKALERENYHEKLKEKVFAQIDK